MEKNRLMTVILPFTLSLGCLPAMAENSSVSLEEITVTANKMEEDIQKVPQSISVLDETEIEEMGLQTSMDVLAQIPGMVTTPDHGIGVTFRGLKRSVFTGNNPIVMYVDDVPIANAYGFDLSLANIERIEVLRGPQGTLYGKDAIGGVINIITKAPDNTRQGEIGTKYSSFNTWHAQANINGPIMADTLFLGVSGQYDKSDGWIKNDYPGMDEDVGRYNNHDLNGYLLFTPTERLHVRLGVDHWTQTTHSPDEKALPYDFMGTGFGYQTLNDFHRDMAEHLRLDIEPEDTTKIDAQADGDFSAGNSADGLVQIHNTELTSWTEELRLTSTNTAGLRWVGGLYLDREEDAETGAFQMSREMMQTPADMEQQSVSDMDTRTQAVFGQVMLPLGQVFELTLGGRYQRFLSDNYTAYASFSQGYMPGGFNTFSMGGNAEENTFEPQKSTSYEIGIKADHDMWRFNAAVFYMDIADIQIYKSPAPGIFVTDNADKAHSFGAELEAAWLPLQGLELSAGISVMQAEYDDYDLGTVTLDGEHMEGAPDHTLRLSAVYHHPDGLYGRADVRHVGNVHYYDGSAQTNAFKSTPMTGGIAGFGDPRTIGVGLSYSF